MNGEGFDAVRVVLLLFDVFFEACQEVTFCKLLLSGLVVFVAVRVVDFCLVVPVGGGDGFEFVFPGFFGEVVFGFAEECHLGVEVFCAGVGAFVVGCSDDGGVAHGVFTFLVSRLVRVVLLGFRCRLCRF